MTLDCLPFMWSETSRYSAIRTIYKMKSHHNSQYTDILVACRCMNHALGVDVVPFFSLFTNVRQNGRMADRLRVRDHDAESGLRMIAQCGASFHRTGTSFRRRISLAIYKAAWTHFVFIFVNLSFQLMMSMSCSSKYFAMWCTRYSRILLHLYLFIYYSTADGDDDDDGDEIRMKLFQLIAWISIWLSPNRMAGRTVHKS